MTLMIFSDSVCFGSIPTFGVDDGLGGGLGWNFNLSKIIPIATINGIRPKTMVKDFLFE